MAELKRNMIELVKEVKEGELVTEKYLTPLFVPLEVTYEALDLMTELNEMGDDISKERKFREKAEIFIADKLYNGQFTKEELRKGLHGPESGDEIANQILFAARGFQTQATKKYLAKKR